MRRAWTEDAVAVEGRHFRSRGTTMRPRPVQQPGPPIWIGGNSTAALRRAVDRGDGWVPFPTPPGVTITARTPTLSSLDDLAVRLQKMHSYAAEVGRTDPIDVCFSGFATDVPGMLEEVRLLEELGVTWTVLRPRDANTRAKWIDSVRRLGDEVIGPSRA
jgi:alkanesulfonate monooxygenase SsuD/methylene tetrahydromethanopterin reductase-like flavin-dependent oxidoreductase (luciferase family)